MARLVPVALSREGDILAPLEVTDLTVEGQGVARHQGRVVFLDDALPGAVVSAVVRRARPKALFAEVGAVLSPSPHEIEPDCPHARECGGCLLRHFAPRALLDWKSRHIEQCLARIGKAEPLASQPPLSGGRPLRNKMSFAFGPAPDGGCLLGLRKRRDHEVVEITDCRLQNARVMELLAEVRRLAAELGLTAWARQDGRKGAGYLRHLVVRSPEYAPQGREQLLVECITGANHKTPAGAGLNNAEAVRFIGQKLMERFSLTGFVHSERSGQDMTAVGDRQILTLGQDFFQERIGHLTLNVPHDAFLQTNSAAALALYERIEAEAAPGPGDVVWDLFCGVGGIGLFLARRAGQVHGCEVSAAAVKAARRNSRALGHTNCRFYLTDLAKGLDADLPGPDVIILDPPRSGISAALAKRLLATRARLLLYVSCDAGTQARDLLHLSSKWRPSASIPVDMFPYTPHIENILVLKQASE